MVAIRRAIVAVHLYRDLELLNPSTRLYVVKRLLVKARPVVDTSIQEADVHIVEEIVFVGPLIRDIVDFKANVRWDVVRLDGGKFGTDDLGTGVKLSKIDRPEACDLLAEPCAVGPGETIPVPVPISRTRCGSSPIGARWSLPSRRSVNM